LESGLRYQALILTGRICDYQVAEGESVDLYKDIDLSEHSDFVARSGDVFRITHYNNSDPRDYRILYQDEVYWIHGGEIEGVPSGCSTGFTTR